MMQGDSYKLGFQILNNAGNPVTPADVNDVEITIGNLSKTYKKNMLVFNSGLWMFPLSQDETFNYVPAAVKGQVRILWANGVLEGKPVYGLRMDESTSKEVL